MLLLCIEGYGGCVPSRMEKYYQTNDVKSRANKNRDLYRTIYDEAEYSNVEGISVIEKNEKIDIDMIRELINSTNTPKQRETKIRVEEPIIKEVEEEKNYDIRDILDKAKSSRPESEKKLSNTQYNILKNINLNENITVPPVKDEDLKNMIEAISNNSKAGYTTDLFDDLKSIHEPKMAEIINEKMGKEEKEIEIDKSFYTSSLGFTSDDFEDLKDMKESIETNNLLTKILIFILLVVIVTGVMFLIYHFKG